VISVPNLAKSFSALLQKDVYNILGVTNFVSPYFVLDTIVNKESASSFGKRVSDLSSSVKLLFLVYVYSLVVPFANDIFTNRGDLVSMAFSGIEDLLNIFFTKTFGEKISYFSYSGVKEISGVKNATGLRSLAVSSIFSNFPLDLASFYLGTGVRSYNIQMRQSSSVVNLGANRVARFGWGTEPITVNIEGVYYLKPFVFWDNYLRTTEIPIANVYKTAVDFVEKIVSSKKSTGYPSYGSLGEILSYVFTTFFREFGHHTYFMFFLDKIYYGWLDMLNISRRSDNPLILDYRLTFIAHPASGWSVWDTEGIRKGLNIISSTKRVFEVKDFLFGEGVNSAQEGSNSNSTGGGNA